MAIISGKISRGFGDYFLIPGWTGKDAVYENVDLTTDLSEGVILRYPFIAAAMSCVVGYDMTLECAKNGLMAVVPSSFTIEEQYDIIRRVKEGEVKAGDIEFNEDPVMINDLKRKIGDAADLYEEYGHSNIPICDRFSTLRGIFRYEEGIPLEYLNVSLRDVLENKAGDSYLKRIIKRFDIKKAKHEKDYFLVSDDVKDIHTAMKEKRIPVMPILNEKGILKKLAFIYKFHGYPVGGAIHTHKGWERRAESLLEAGADMIFIDSSDAKSDFQEEVIIKFKKKYGNVPLVAGNMVDAEGYRRLVNAGADLVKVGMGSGGSCLTTENRGYGRGIATALLDVSEERERGDRKVPIIADGGLGTRRIRIRFVGDKRLTDYEHDASSISKALAITGVKAIMMGTGFNMFEEAAGGIFEHEGKRYKERWGEGSLKAMTLARYGVGEDVRRAHVEEGIYDYVSVAGRLKPGIEKTALNLKMNYSSAGAKNTKEFWEKATLELASGAAQADAGIG